MFFDVPGGSKWGIFRCVFFSVPKDACFEIVKKQLVFIAFPPHRFSKLWQQNMFFLIFEGFLPRPPPNRKCWYFAIRMQNSPPKKVFLVIFRGCLQSSQNGKMSLSFFILFKDPFWTIFTFFLWKSWYSVRPVKNDDFLAL